MPQLSLEQRKLFNELQRSRMKIIRALEDPSVRGVWASIIDKYPESAHFIYELLQNADDAEATEVSITLCKTELLFKHNGIKHFDITPLNAERIGDLNSITGIGYSSKESTVNKIGKFGVGFKSVLQYTDTPEIYDDYFKFKIENYIVPTLLEYDRPERKEGETLFVMPFKNAEVSFRDIKGKLETLQNPLLFLHHLKKIEVFYGQRLSAVLQKDVLETMNDEDKRLKMERLSIQSPNRVSQMFMFSRYIRLKDEKGKTRSHVINVGFYYDPEKKQLQTGFEQPIYCFFPTKESFGTCFVSHAPFLLTDNRQNLKPGENVNVLLIESLAELATDAIAFLRDYGLSRQHLLIDENITSIVPVYKKKYGWLENEYAPLEKVMRSAFAKMLAREPLLITRDGNYVTVEDGFIGTPRELVDLLSTNQLRELIFDKDAEFLNWELAQRIHQREDDLFGDVRKIFSEDFACNLTSQFMAKQDKKWVVRMYNFLRSDAPKLWKVTGNTRSIEYLPVRKAPIIKIQTGEWVAPFLDVTTANVFLPMQGHSNSEYRFIAKEYTDDEMAMKFFKELEIKEPDQLDYIKSVVLPKYKDARRLTEENMEADLMVILNIYQKTENISEVNAKSLLALLRKNLRLADRDTYPCYASELYFPTAELLQYFKDNEDVRFLNVEMYKKVYTQFRKDFVDRFFSQMGVGMLPRVVTTKPYNIYSLSQRIWRQIDTSDFKHYKISDYVLCGFDFWCQNNCTKEISVFLWNEVLPKLPFSEYENLTVEYRRKWAKYYDETYATSSFKDNLQHLKWIYDGEGKCLSAHEVSVESLAAEYDRSNGLIEFLGIEKQEKSIIELGGTEEQEKIYEKGKLLDKLCKESGLSEEELTAAATKAGAEKRARERAAAQGPLSDQEETAYNEESVEEKLEKRWESRKNRTPHRPHTTSSDRDFVDMPTATDDVSLNSEEPFFDDKSSYVDSPSNVGNTSRAEQQLKAKRTETKTDAEQAAEQVELMQLFQEEPRYTFRWFKLLMDLMHSDKSSSSRQQAKIDFAEWEFVCDNKMLRLANPSSPVPTWGLDADQQSFFILSERSDKIEGTIIKAEDNAVELFVKDQPHVAALLQTAKKFRVCLERSSGITDSLEERFAQLGFDDAYNLNDHLAKDITFIYGPPGTGKTTRLVSMVHDMLKEAKGMNILVLTPTNKAADVVAEKMVADEVCFNCLTRFGATESLSLIEDAAVVENRETADMTLLENNVVVTTAARYAYDYVQPNDTFICNFPWDYIIIDEASMLDLVTATLILYKGGATKYIISGDPKQIQPVVQNNMPTFNIYNMVGLYGFADAINNYDRFPVISLQTQYRSIPAIGNLVSQFAYNGIVKADNHRIPQKPLALDGISIKSINFLGFDIQEFNQVKGISSIGGSAFHLYSAIFTYNMVEYVIKQIEKRQYGQSYSIGIVCPYRAEADAIKQMLEMRPIATSNVQVMCGTVHSFQGDECDIMFVVLNTPPNCTPQSHINNENILNVAMSRARDYLFFVLPSGQPKGFTQKNRLGNLVPNEERTIQSCSDIEATLFGSSSFIVDNTQVMCHMPVNVYCEQTTLYEVKMSDDALDIKIAPL